jgi:Response regulator receiver domain
VSKSGQYASQDEEYTQFRYCLGPLRIAKSLLRRQRDSRAARFCNKWKNTRKRPYVSLDPAPQIVVVDDEPVIASTLATILEMNGFSAKFFTSPLEALTAARSKAPDLPVSDVTSAGISGIVFPSQMRMITMNRSQEIDHAYHEEMLLLLLARRHKLPATSNQMPDLDIEILAAWNLVRSYRMMQARQRFKAALEPAEASRIDSAGHGVGGAKSASHKVLSRMREAPAA